VLSFIMISMPLSGSCNGKRFLGHELQALGAGIICQPLQLFPDCFLLLGPRSSQLVLQLSFQRLGVRRTGIFLALSFACFSAFLISSLRTLLLMRDALTFRVSKLIATRTPDHHQ